jgi:hypothetical protein
MEEEERARRVKGGRDGSGREFYAILVHADADSCWEGGGRRREEAEKMKGRRIDVGGRRRDRGGRKREEKGEGRWRKEGWSLTGIDNPAAKTWKMIQLWLQFSSGWDLGPKTPEELTNVLFSLPPPPPSALLSPSSPFLSLSLSFLPSLLPSLHSLPRSSHQSVMDPNQKIISFIRHGQSEANHACDTIGSATGIFNPHLTEKVNILIILKKLDFFSCMRTIESTIGIFNPNLMEKVNTFNYLSSFFFWKLF